jgi:predicted transcriptional regulator of viral defense system
MLATGRESFTVEEAQSLLGGSLEATRRALARLRGQHLLFSPARGFWVPVPARYRAWGEVPPSDFVDGMMVALRRDYYVALLSAAALHDAYEVEPATLQVMCSPPLRTRHFKHVGLAFTTSSHVVTSSTVVHGEPPMRVATREVTALDMIERSTLCGGLAQVARILTALGELDGLALANLALNRGRATTRRAGWMIERFGKCAELDYMRRVAQRESDSAPLLDLRSAPDGHIDRLWGVRVNVDLAASFDCTASPVL